MSVHFADNYYGVGDTLREELLGAGEEGDKE